MEWDTGAGWPFCRQATLDRMIREGFPKEVTSEPKPVRWEGTSHGKTVRQWEHKRIVNKRPWDGSRLGEFEEQNEKWLWQHQRYTKVWLPCVTATLRLTQQFKSLLLNNSMFSMPQMANSAPKYLLTNPTDWPSPECQTQVVEHRWSSQSIRLGWGQAILTSLRELLKSDVGSI